MALTIIAYHYVRNLLKSRYPQIRGLTTERFEGQLDYIEKHYTVCSGQEVISAVRGETELPPNPCWLTFDDGFIDHFVTVFPRLLSRGMVGSFFPPVRSAQERKLLATHKTHFILSSISNHRQLVQDFFDLLKPYRSDYDLPQNEIFYRTHTNRREVGPRGSPDGDSSDTVFIKKLQHALPEEVHAAVFTALFERYVKDDETVLAEELYMDISQLRSLVRNGMEIGGHGYSHIWLDRLARNDQEDEIRRTASFLATVYEHEPLDWVMDYPFGRHNGVTVDLLKNAGCAVGLTTQADLVSNLAEPFEFGRLDTNDIPSTGDAEICEWTRKAQEGHS